MDTDRPSIHLAVGRRYDRIEALLSPSSAWPQVRCTVLPSIHDAFRAMDQRPDVDATEMSTAFHLTRHDGRQGPVVALPVFTSRAFRFGNIYVRADSPLSGIEHLRGCTVGLPEFGMTMGVWLRGMMADLYDLHPQEIRWRTARQPILTDVPARVHTLGIDVAFLGGRDLWDCLADGTVDAAIGQPPRGSRAGFRRLLADFGQHDLAYWQRSAAFPIMHTVVVRRDICDRSPESVRMLFGAMCWAKRTAMDELDDTISYRSTLPFQQADVHLASALLGRNWWPYGIEANRSTLEALIRYLHEQGLIQQPVAIEDLFWSGAHDLLDEPA